MDKAEQAPGGTVVSIIAYKSDHIAAHEELKLIDETPASKGQRPATLLARADGFEPKMKTRRDRMVRTPCADRSRRHGRRVKQRLQVGHGAADH